MKITYIAHPISGDIPGNLAGIRAIVRHINLTEPGVVPFAPYYLDCVAMDDNIPAERERGIRNDKALISAGFIDELRLYGPRVSKGMAHEITLAQEHGIPIVAMTPETSEWFRKYELNPSQQLRVPNTHNKTSPKSEKKFLRDLRFSINNGVSNAGIIGMIDQRLKSQEQEERPLFSLLIPSYNLTILQRVTGKMGRIQQEFDESYMKLRTRVGKEKAEVLLARFKNEAYASGARNHEYIISKINSYLQDSTEPMPPRFPSNITIPEGTDPYKNENLD